MTAIADLLQTAVEFHQSGNLAQAEPLYKQVLQMDPAHFEALHLLGLLAHQSGHQEQAIDLLRQAIVLNPAAESVPFNLGIMLMSRGQGAEAAQCFRHTLRLNPRHVEAHINLGNTFMNQGQLAEAAECYQQALSIQPLHADAHINLGNVFLSQGEPDAAIASYREALRINPGHAHGLNNLGNALLGQGQIDEAIRYYREALRLDPTNAKAHYNLGNVYKDLGQWTEAAGCYRQAVRCQPIHAEAHNNLGIILQKQGQFAAAAECYREALRINSNYADAYNNLGNALKDQGQILPAIECYRQATHAQPNHSEAFNNLGLALKEQGDFAQAAACFEQALRIDPNHRRAQWNRCLLCLLQGDWENGWRDFELRWAQPGMMRRPFEEPRWDGSPLVGKTILVHAEHGLGDTVQFLRYLPLVKERGGNVLFECQPSLFKLLAKIKGVDQLVAAGTPLPPFDVQASLLSLPAFFLEPLASIPADNPYLFADPKLIEFWRQELRQTARREHAGREPFKIGIAWQGHPEHPEDRLRSVSLSYFETLANVEGVRLVSLQVGAGLEQLETVSFPVIELGSQFTPDSLTDLAGALINLDLVVTVDTALAHVAGALGMPTWIALPLVPDFRWQLERTDSPWYPTVRLFRQRRLGDWSEVFTRMAAALGRIMSNDQIPNDERMTKHE